MGTCSRVPGQEEGAGTRPPRGRRGGSRVWWGSRGAAAVGEGRGGRLAEGGGAARSPPAGRASGSRCLACCAPSVGGVFLPPACCPPMKIKTKTSRRGAVFASEAASAAQGESPLSKVSGLGREPWGGQHGLGLRASSAERRQRPVIFAEDRRACPAPSGCGARTARCWARANPYHPGPSSPVGRHTVE